ncbi:MAG: HAMP domain-containing histidine kinase [Oscillospiraceae bacterium]|nr:HAMP domain-containing histidine kinase [Oscillospiraceae bacterium]
MREYNEEELKLLTEVLPNVAQELRGAMANVYAAANRLAPISAREQNAAVDKNAAVFTQSYYRMYRVIGNMTDAPKLAETGKFAALGNDDIVGVVRGVCEKAEPLFDGQGVTLTFESDKPGQIIAMDAELIERMLLNLLSNALKFTPKGGSVGVRVRVTDRRVYLTVSDTGRGIAPDKLEHVFDRFLVTDAMDPPPHGVGLGLALCRRIAQGHGGSIVAESEEGRGATFTVTLPNVKSPNGVLRQPRTEYAGGFNRTLLELSDALNASAFTYQYLD